jgi:predicted nucleotidyltransferase component of viral defense system
VRIDSAYVNGIAQATGFDATNLEKVVRLRQLLIEFHKHPFLRERLVLKGGTAVNLFYLGLARLSVDIDLNYVGQLDRGEMFLERPQVAKAVDQISVGLGYRLRRGVDEHALMEWYLNYDNHMGTFDQIQVEINFLMRVCALPPKVLRAASIGNEETCDFPVLAVEELFGGKIKAMIDRRHPRDLYDLFRFGRAALPHDPDVMGKVAVLFCSTMDRDFRTYDMERFVEIDQAAIHRLLYPLLRAGDRPTGAEMFVVAKPILQSVLDHTRQHDFLEAMATGQYKPELLFPKHPEIVDRIKRHPALLWKAENVARYLSQRRPK